MKLLKPEKPRFPKESEEYLEKDGVPYVRDKLTRRLFRMEGFRRIEIEGLSSRARIRHGARKISKEDALGLAIRRSHELQYW